MIGDDEKTRIRTGPRCTCERVRGSGENRKLGRGANRIDQAVDDERFCALSLGRARGLGVVDVDEY